MPTSMISRLCLRGVKLFTLPENKDYIYWDLQEVFTGYSITEHILLLISIVFNVLPQNLYR